MAEKMMDPNKTVCVVKNSAGKEVGRIAATAKNAEAYITELGRCYGSVTIDYIEDADYAMVSRLFR